MKDQKDLWDNAHLGGDINHYSNSMTEFAAEVLKIVHPSSRILELGCGVGNDSVGFAKAGHTVVSTDFSDVAITKNAERFKDTKNLDFKVMDMSKPFEFQDNEFDAVYARLSLHYFTNDVTKDVISEIYRVLKQNGYFCFLCKSIDDPLYGKGLEIEKDMYELDGHTRHFFSEDYAKLLLQNNFVIQKLESGNEKFYGRDSAFIKVIARAIKK